MLTERKNNNKKPSLSSWLLADPIAYSIPSIHLLDRVLRFLLKTFYVALRIFLRITLGKTNRKKLQFYHKLGVCIYSISFSFYFFMFLYKTIKIFRLCDPSLVKIIVPKYNYKIYCPLTEDDYHHMTTREDDIIENFQPKISETVIDGAHYGRYTLIAAKRIGSKGKVIAIEADPKNFDILNKNINGKTRSRNNIDNLIIPAS